MSSVTAAKTPKRRASGLLRDDEQFVIVAVSKAFSAPWRLGKNPPDAYLDLTFGTVAVEISTLVQPITSANETLPKKSVERPILDIGDELNHILHGSIPDGYRVSVHFRPPLREAAKTKRKIASVIRSLLRDIRTFPRHHYLQVHNNPISIYLDYQIDPNAKKVTIGFNQNVADVGENTQHILKDRIKVKAYKCRNLIGRGPLWLALLNDYCLTDADTYRYAFSRMSVQHPFDKILIVGGDASVAEIFGSWKSAIIQAEPLQASSVPLVRIWIKAFDGLESGKWLFSPAPTDTTTPIAEGGRPRFQGGGQRAAQSNLDKPLKILVTGTAIAAALAAFCAITNEIGTARHEQKIASLESAIAALQGKCAAASEESVGSGNGYEHSPLICDPKKLSGYAGLGGVQRDMAEKTKRNWFRTPILSNGVCPIL